MHIVLLNQFFWPDTVATSQMLTAVARSLGEEHDVTVLCGGGGVAPADSADNPRPRANIIRIRNAAFGYSKLARVASYMTYLAGILWHGFQVRHPDCFVTLTTPPILPVIGAVFARVRRARFVIWEMDVYPDIATDIGYFKRHGIVDRFLGTILDWSRLRADVIIVLGEEMKARLMARGIPACKIVVAENWSNGAKIVPAKFPGGPVTVLYSGNLGLAHEVTTIKAVIERLANDLHFRFIFAGGGPRRPELEDFCRLRSITNVEFRPFCTNSQLSHSLAEGHLGLVTQIPATVGSVVPSKIYGIMAAGRPLLYIGPEASTPARHIRSFDCGWRIGPGDVDGAIRLLQALNSHRQLLVDAGQRSRAAFDRHFDRRIGVKRIMEVVLAFGSLERSV